MRLFFGRLLLSLGLYLALAVGVFSFAASSAEVAPAGVVKAIPSQAKADFVWTREAMLSAKPVQKGNSKHTNGFSPTAQQGIEPMATPVGNYSQYPYSTIGKVFFRDAQGGTHQCSGTVITSSNNSVVDTAAHCVNEGSPGGRYYSNWIFCPQYYNGSCPKGQFSAALYVIHSGWLSAPDNFGYDYADVKVNTSGGQTVVGAVGGGVAYAYNLSRSQNWYALGYPTAPPFTGQTMQLSQSATIYILESESEQHFVLPASPPDAPWRVPSRSSSKPTGEFYVRR